MSRWIEHSSGVVGCLTHPLTQVVLTSLRKQILKRQLRVIGLQIPRAGNAWDVQCFAHRIQMESDDAGSKTDRRDAALGGEPAHGGFAHLQDFGELSRG